MIKFKVMQLRPVDKPSRLGKKKIPILCVYQSLRVVLIWLIASNGIVTNAYNDTETDIIKASNYC